MGFNTTVVIYNDSLFGINTDTFGVKLCDAVLSMSRGHSPIKVDNAASVIETHHVDGTSLVAVGGNDARSLGVFYPYGEAEDKDVLLLKALADKLGYRVVRKSGK